jgi:membrane dipeptidase
MLDAPAGVEGAVIFSHSSARALNDHPRNVSDTGARAGARQSRPGHGHLSADLHQPMHSGAGRRTRRGKARLNAPPFGGLYIGEPAKAAAALADWERAHPRRS